MTDLNLLRELLNEADEPYAPFSPTNWLRYEVNGVRFDNERGMGNTPNGQEIMYFGFIAMMTPKEFRQLAAPLAEPVSLNKLRELYNEGRGIASPSLTIDAKSWRTGGTDIYVTGHEGRNRCYLLEELGLGDTEMPVFIVLSREMRARDLNDDFFRTVRDHGMYCEDSRDKKIAGFDRFVLKEKWVNLESNHEQEEKEEGA